jgi:hypothetical protein
MGADLFHIEREVVATDETQMKHGITPAVVKSVFNPCSIRGSLRFFLTA